MIMVMVDVAMGDKVNVKMQTAVVVIVRLSHFWWFVRSGGDDGGNGGGGDVCVHVGGSAFGKIVEVRTVPFPSRHS
jgi:GTPase involved in cell partitioning and DNA repair